VTHWADVLAAELIKRRGAGPHVFATAITPSGPIHVGNMREVLTTEAVFRAAKDAGAKAELLYIADDYDPLRKVYPFLGGHPAVDYAAHVGKPLREVPCPCGGHGSYSEHFLEPFLRNLRDLGVAPTVLSAYDLYHEGRYTEHTVRSLDAADRLRRIIETVSKRQLPGSWAPFNPQCPACRRISGVEVKLYEYPELSFRCACGEAATVDVRRPGIGKLPWRVDWPARWHFLGVTFESFGKDHGASGGSWDTGVRIVREVFEGREPEHVMYEFLQLKGKGAMHSSTGLAVSAELMLRMVPPEVLRYLLVRQSPRKHIDFDPGLGLLGLADEFDRLERVRSGAEANPGDLTEVERTYELSMPGQVPDHLPVQVNIRHLVTVVQMADTVEGVEEILRRSGELREDLDDVGRRRLAERVEHVRVWLDEAAPDQVRFQVRPALPEDLALGDEDKAFLGRLADALATAPWDGQSVHDAVHAAAQATGISQGQAFRAVYRTVLGQDRGPRAGFFLASLDRGFVVDRFRAAA